MAVLCGDGDILWIRTIHSIVSGYAEMFERYRTFEEWEQSTRTCDYCGTSFDEGFMCGDGEHYACEDCFGKMREGYGWVDRDDIPEGATCDTVDGYWYEKRLVMNPSGPAFPSVYEDTGWFWTQFWV